MGLSPPLLSVRHMHRPGSESVPGTRGAHRRVCLRVERGAQPPVLLSPRSRSLPPGGWNALRALASAWAGSATTRWMASGPGQADEQSRVAEPERTRVRHLRVAAL